MSSDTGKFYTNYSFEYPNENVRVATSSFQDVPSNKKPLINLTMNGILCPSEKLHEIKMKFEGDIPQKDQCAQCYGTFVLCKDVYNVRKVIKTAWDKETDTLTVIIDLREYNVRPKRPAQFSFSIQINDDPAPATALPIGCWWRGTAIINNVKNYVVYCPTSNIKKNETCDKNAESLPASCKMNDVGTKLFKTTCLQWKNNNGHLSCKSRD